MGGGQAPSLGAGALLHGGLTAAEIADAGPTYQGGPSVRVDGESVDVVHAESLSVVSSFAHTAKALEQVLLLAGQVGLVGGLSETAFQTSRDDRSEVKHLQRVLSDVVAVGSSLIEARPTDVVCDIS